MSAGSKIDPRLRVLYLLSVAGGVFVFRRLDVITALVAAQAVLWLVVGLTPQRLLRQIKKLWFFTLFIVVSYALTSEDPATDHWVALHLARWTVSVNAAGAPSNTTRPADIPIKRSQ